MMLQRAEQGNRLNHGMINVICSGLSEIVFKLLSPCTLFVDFYFICPHPIFYCHSDVIAALDFVYANTFYGFSNYQMGVIFTTQRMLEPYITTSDTQCDKLECPLLNYIFCIFLLAVTSDT